MADVIYDCSQFLTFDLNDSVDASPLLKTIFEERNYFKILNQSEIAQRKISHLTEFLANDIVELENQEFIGEFDDWVELNEVPQPIQQFGENIRDFFESDFIKHLTVIFVRYAYNEKNTDTIFVGDYYADSIFDGLYHVSCFGSSGNVIVLRLSKS